MFADVTMNRPGLNISLLTDKHKLEHWSVWDGQSPVPRLGYSQCWAYSDQNANLLNCFVYRLAGFKQPSHFLLRSKSPSWPPTTVGFLENSARVEYWHWKPNAVSKESVTSGFALLVIGEKHSYIKREHCYKKKTHFYMLHCSNIPMLNTWAREVEI